MPSSPIKPPVRAHRASALRRFSGMSLTDSAVDALFDDADVMIEGALNAADPPAYFGSVMIAFDLRAFGRRFRGLEDPEERERILASIRGSVRFRLRAHRMACAALYRRYPDRAVGTVTIESAFRVDGERLLMDLDLEAEVRRLGRPQQHQR